jgi:hypothetical protein
MRLMHAKKKLQDCLCLIKKGSTQLREFAIDLALLKRLVSKRRAATLLKMSMTSAIGRIFGEGQADSPVPKALVNVFKPLYAITGSDDKMTELLVQAMMDPELFARLMIRATEQNADNFMNALRGKLPTFF